LKQATLTDFTVWPNYGLYGNFPHITPNTHFFRKLSVYYSPIKRSQETFPNKITSNRVILKIPQGG